MVKGAGSTLLGRNWLDHLCLNWQQINYVHPGPLQAVLKSHEAVSISRRPRLIAALPGLDSGRLQCYPSLHKGPFSPIRLQRFGLPAFVSEGILEHVELT